MQRSKIGMLLGAIAAYGAYKYSKMSAEEKNALKSKGRDFFNKNLGGLNNLFSRKTSPVTNTNGY
jgi:hypothetical protein